MAPQDFLQEYIEEVREHLQDLERSLLTLEQEGANKGEIQQIFRVAHSIKGASAYMGFERLAGLTHELESLISQIQAEARPVTSKGISALLSCVDFISSAVGIIAETQEEPELPESLLTELRAFLTGNGENETTLEPPAGAGDGLDAVPGLEAASEISTEPVAPEEQAEECQGTEECEPEVAQEEDRELYGIFLQSFAENFGDIARLFSGSRKGKLPEAEIEKAREALDRLISSSQYMNYEKVTAELKDLQTGIVTRGGAGSRKGLHKEYEAVCDRLRKLLPDLELPVEGAPVESVQTDVDVPIEDDEELLAIYADSFRETFSELTALIAVAPDALLTEPEYRSWQMLVERLASSSRYMDFGEVVHVLHDFSQAISQGWENGGVSGELLAEGIASCRVRLQPLLPQTALPEEVAGNEAAGDEGAPQIEEDDEELLGIFMDSFHELFSEIIGLVQAVGDSGLSEEDLAKAKALLGRMISSSQYMDYAPVSLVLEEWEQSLQMLFEQGLAGGDILLGLVRSNGDRLRELLPSFECPPIEPAEKPAETPSEDAMALSEPFVAYVPEQEEVLFEDLAVPIEAVMDLVEEDLLREMPKPGNGTTHVEAEVPIVPALVREEDLSPVVAAALKEPAEVAPSQQSGDKKASKGKRSSASGEEANSATSLRVDALKVDQLLNQVGELVVARSEFIQTAAFFRDILQDLTSSGALPKSELKRLRTLSFRMNESTQSLGRVANDLQESVMRIRMLPISHLFQRFPRVVRDQSLKLGKKVDLVVEGGETEIDKRVLEQMQDPVIQFIRNAIAHGIEPPEERRRLGKPETGTIRLAAWHEGDYVVLQIEDDGGGVNAERLKEVLKQRRELSESELARLTDEEVVYAIFMPGVSTHSRVDGAAGRGVGLDVVKEKVERMNGAVEVESVPGAGTRFTVRIPLTVAIIRALLVRGGKQVFTVPLSSVSEILRYRHLETHTIEGFQVVSLRGKTIPLVHLGQLLGISVDQEDDFQKFTVVVSTSFREVGLVVDGLLGEREVVIKPLEDEYHAFDGFSGATLLGDGAVSLILDVSALLKRMRDPYKRAESTGQSFVH